MAHGPSFSWFIRGMLYYTLTKHIWNYLPDHGNVSQKLVENLAWILFEIWCFHFLPPLTYCIGLYHHIHCTKCSAFYVLFSTIQYTTLVSIVSYAHTQCFNQMESIQSYQNIVFFTKFTSLIHSYLTRLNNDLRYTNFRQTVHKRDLFYHILIGWLFMFNKHQQI